MTGAVAGRLCIPPRAAIFLSSLQPYLRLNHLADKRDCLLWTVWPPARFALRGSRMVDSTSASLIPLRIARVVLPRELTGLDANIVVMVARHFPTGAHKVGPAYSCLTEKQIVGELQPGRDRLVFPSTGNYGIGGAWVGPRMNYESLVVLP